MIDEIGQLTDSMFDGLEAGARAIRQSSLFFGGIQLLLVGDTVQIGTASFSKKNKFFFQSPKMVEMFAVGRTGHTALRGAVGVWVELTLHFRQHEREFIKVLEEVRRADISPVSVAVLNQRHLQKDAQCTDGTCQRCLYILQRRNPCNAQASLC